LAARAVSGARSRNTLAASNLVVDGAISNRVNF
jgi:hypothetical protein